MWHRAYGFAGTIAGAVLQGTLELPRERAPNPTGHTCAIFAVSAKTSQGLQAYINNYLEYCCKQPPETFHDVCYTATSSREHYRHRFACVPKDMEDLINRLKAAPSLPHSKPTRPRLVFGFPGQGSQYQGMARELAHANLDFKYLLTRVAEQASEIAGFSVISFLLDSTAPHDLDINESRHAQVCIFVYQYSVFQWLKGLAILPDAVLGHSIGEIAAAGEFVLFDGVQRFNLVQSGQRSHGSEYWLTSSGLSSKCNAAKTWGICIYGCCLCDFRSYRTNDR